MTRRMHPLGSVFLVLLLTSCGDGRNPTNALFDQQNRHTLLLIEEAPTGFEDAVGIDSALWRPTAVFPAPGQTLEIVGDYEISFRNDGDVPLDLRDDLRFFDDGDFLVDNHIPFALPLRLPPQSTTWQRGSFILRGGEDAGRYGLRTLRVAIRLSRVEGDSTSGG